MQAFVDFVNNPMVKTLLLLVGGVALKKWPAFVTKFVPLALLVVSGILSALQALFPALVPAAHACIAQAVTIPLPTPHQPWWQYLLTSVLMPVLLAVGAHSTTKNTIQALK